MRAGILGRVSKGDGTQDPENQLRQLRDFAKAMNYEVVGEYVDYASGGRNDREQFLQMLKDADARKFDLLLIWSLDRMSREGISNTLGYLERLKRAKVAVRSLTESWLDTTDSGLGELLISIFAWVAAQERKRIIERTKAGLEKARANGKILGRPEGSKDKKDRRKSGYYRRWSKEG